MFLDETSLCYTMSRLQDDPALSSKVVKHTETSYERIKPVVVRIDGGFILPESNYKADFILNGTELSLMGNAHPTVDQGFRPFARIDFNRLQ